MRARGAVWLLVGFFGLPLLALAVTSCSVTQARGPGLDELVAGKEGDDCELRLHIEQRPTSHAMALSIEPGNIGTFAVGKPKVGKEWGRGVCVKRPGAPLTFPHPIYVTAGEPEFCNGSARRDVTVVPASKEDGKIKVCEWNGTFRAVRPFTFTLVAGDGKLPDFVRLVRVFRNGDLAYQWLADGAGRPERLTIDGQVLTVRNFSAAMPPHMANLDLRILPAGVVVDDAVLTARIANDSERNRERWRTVVFAARAAASKQMDPEVKTFYECFQWQLRDVEAKVRRLVDGNKEEPRVPEGCDGYEFASKMNGSDWSAVEEYQKLKSATTTQIEAIQTKLAQKLSAIEEEALKETLDAARKKLAAFVAKKVAEGRSADAIHGQLGNLDALITSVAESVDRARELAVRIRSEAVRLASDDKAQVEAFQQLTTALSKTPSVFEPRNPNPSLLPGEHGMAMTYADSFQLFMLAPWFGVPYRVRDLPGAASLETAAIPILDVVGMRWQFGTSRFGDLRIAAGIAGFKDSDIPEGTTPDNATARTDVFNWAPEVSVGFGTLKIAGGWVLNDRVLSDSSRWNRLRVFVGVDLLKLITGKNVEAL